MTQSDYILVLCVSGGLLSVALGFGMQRVGPNRFYGVRTPATFADRRVWRDANRQSGKGLIALGVCIVLFSLALIAVGGNRWVLGVGALLTSTLGWAVASVWYASEREAYYQRIDRGLASEELRNDAES